MMRILNSKKDYGLSCGILLVTGFRNDKNSRQDIIKDLTDLDGHENKFVKKSRVWDAGKQTYELVDSAFMMCSLNAGQCRIWRPILIGFGYREVVDPLTNPNSGRKITIFVRTRKPKARVAKKKEKKS